MATGPAKRTARKIVIDPKRATAVMLQRGPAGIPRYAETTEVIAAAMANARGCAGRKVHLIAAKASRGVEEAPVLHTTIRGHALPEGQPLLPPPMFHSTPLPALHRLSSDLPEPSSAHLSFNQSQSSLPPLELGGVTIAPSILRVLLSRGAPSIAGPSLPSTSVATVNFSEDHIKQIFSLACEGRHLKERITWEFIRLSSQEVLFCTQVQSTGHESLASRTSRPFHHIL